LIDKVNDAAKEDTENETDSESNSVRGLNETNTESKKRSVHCLRNDAESNEIKETTFLGRVAANLDLDLLRDRRYIAIVLGKYRTNTGFAKMRLHPTHSKT